MFKSFFEEFGTAKGNKWDDIVIKFEWLYELNAQSDLKSWKESSFYVEIQAACKSHEHQFDNKLVDQWIES